ncbi:MAG TPA: TetR/AcrR family transcriptional regulator [Bacteroidota bacterium]|nr:TetR/AcrR family transcriptional regulator [Bacteroidota bacterium]
MNGPDLQIRERILETARDHFLQYGFSNVTMSDIAANLGMSKKTMYAYFQSKEELASEMVKELQSEMSSRISALADDESVDFLEKLNRILDATAAHHSRMSPYFRMDLQKHAPGIFQCSDDFQNQQVYAVVSRLIQEGMRKGAFRSDLEEPIVTAMFVAAFKSILKPESLARLQRPISEIIHGITNVMFRGILSDGALVMMQTQPQTSLTVSTDHSIA